MARRSLAALALALLPALAPLAPARVAAAQVEEGATMTVLRGQVAVLRPDGTAVQPAPSGTVVRAGDEIRTLSRSGALITFFLGTEIELGEDTILVVERVSREGERVDISLKQVFGASLHRVQSFADPGSAYRVEVGGAVAAVRGTTFLVYGPTDEGVVGIVCLEDCDARTTFAGCPVAPNLGLWAEVERGRVVSECRPFAPRGDPWGAPAERRLRPAG
jgi:hypothetical protein